MIASSSSHVSAGSGIPTFRGVDRLGAAIWEYSLSNLIGAEFCDLAVPRGLGTALVIYHWQSDLIPGYCDQPIRRAFPWPVPAMIRVGLAAFSGPDSGAYS